MRFCLILIFLLLISIVSTGNNIESYCIHICENVINHFESEMDSTLAASIENVELGFLAESYSFDIQLISSHYDDDSWITLKRVTKNPRNIYNQAASYEIDVLNDFENSTSHWEARIIWNNTSKKHSFYYFKPIRVKNSCLLCHGIGDDVPAIVYSGMNDLYTRDQAFGYQEGDLIGMYVLSMNLPIHHDSLTQFVKHTAIEIGQPHP